MKTHKYARKPFYVDAVRVSEENMEEVAQWCGGEIKLGTEGKHIKVAVFRPINDRQSEAYVGDWVLEAGNSFKVYTPRAFDKSFERVKGQLTKEQADAAGIKPPHEPRQGQKQQKKAAPKPQPPRRRPDNPVISEEMAAKINAGNVGDATISATKLEVKEGPLTDEENAEMDALAPSEAEKGPEWNMERLREAEAEEMTAAQREVEIQSRAAARENPQAPATDEEIEEMIRQANTPN